MSSRLMLGPGAVTRATDYGSRRTSARAALDSSGLFGADDPSERVAPGSLRQATRSGAGFGELTVVLARQVAGARARLRFAGSRGF